MQATFTHLIGNRKGECEKFHASKISVGRAADNDLRFPDSERRVSSHHASISRNDDQYILRDLGSTNGTMINGRRVMAAELSADDLIEFGAGGPLVRFGIEMSPTEKLSRDKLAEISAARSPRQSSVEILAERAVRNRASNAGIIFALAVALLIGALGGVVVSARFVPIGRGRLNVVEVVEHNSPAVVFIRTEFDLVDSNGQVVDTEARSGSGFVVSSKGLIVTNRHLIHDWDYSKPPVGLEGQVRTIEVIFPGRSPEQAIAAELYRLSTDSKIDLAILKVATSPNLPVVYGVESNPTSTEQGDEVVAIGYPLGMDLLKLSSDDRVTPSISTGVVSRISADFIQLNLRAYKGNSGGPLLNRKGQVIGIVTASVTNAQEIVLCTPMSAAMALIKDELSYGEHQSAH